jgi:nicotinate phosphoribosyltransferase
MAKIIKSLLDSDLYKITQMQAVYQKYPEADATYSFVTRSSRSIPEGDKDFMSQVEDQIERLGEIAFTPSEISYLQELGLFSNSFLDYLEHFTIPTDTVKIGKKRLFNNLVDLTIEGKWLDTILLEVPILAIVSELWSKQYGNSVFVGGRNKLRDKIGLIHDLNIELPGFKFADFGTRRRHSWMWQEEVVKQLSCSLPENFTGTSNVMLANRFEIKPVGTMAHEWLQAHQVLAPIHQFQRTALETWASVYRGKLGIALTDTINMDAFLDEFDLYNAKLYDGCRQDSGDPFAWTEKLLAHYKRLGINPKTKTAVYSDGLDIPTAIKIFKRYKDSINVMFGIGTNLTNDLGDNTYKPLSIVIKMDSLNGFPVAKISDTPEKAICKDPAYLQYLKNTYKIK